MAKPFDVTLKHMLEHHPADCARLAGVQPAGRIAVIDADVSTISAGADKVLRLDERPPWLIHFEFQASYDADLPQRILRYNVLLHGRHGLPVQSVVLLLRRESDGREMTGTVRHALPDGRQYLEFHYNAIRIWQKSVDDILAGGVGTLPLAPIAAGSQEQAASAVLRMKQRLAKEVSSAEAGVLWTQTDILLGLRYSKEFAAELLRGVRGMKESVTYQAIVEEGVIAEAQRFLVRIGTKHLGSPDRTAQAAIEGISDPERLESLGERVSEVSSWAELLAGPRTKRRNGRKRKN